MVVFAWAPTGGVERTLCRVSLVVALPLFLLAASSLLFVGRGRLTGDSERVLLVVIIVWAFVLALLRTRRTERPTPLVSDMPESEAATPPSSAGWGRPLRWRRGEPP